MSDIRRENFNLLYSVALTATQDDFGRAIGLNQSEVSQYNTGKKAISNYRARDIEREFKLPAGWMDRANARLLLSADEYELIERVRQRGDGTAKSLVQLLDNLK